MEVILFIIINLFAFIVINSIVYNKKINQLTQERDILRRKQSRSVDLSKIFFEILSQKGEKIKFKRDKDSTWIDLEYEGNIITITFYNEDANYFYVTYLICTFDLQSRNEVLERMNRVNAQMKYVNIVIQDNSVYSTCDACITTDIIIEDVLYCSLNAVIQGHNKFWKLEEKKIDLDISLN